MNIALICPQGVQQLSSAAGVDKSLIKITRVSVGSVIIEFTIQSSGGSSLAETQTELEAIKAKLDEAVKTGTLAAYPEAIILNYQSGVIVVTGLDTSDCPTGYYRDSTTKICHQYPIVLDKKDNTGAIIGGILGGAAVFGVLVVLFYAKRGGFSGQNPHAKYDMTLTHSPPESPRSRSRSRNRKY